MAAVSYKQADSRAYHAPARYNNDLDGLIEYLIKPFPNDEMMRARVLFAWIVYHIQYDRYEAKTHYESRNDMSWAQPIETFNKRTGVCRDNAVLFDYMAQKANLKTHLILGTAGGGGHAWNAVVINGKWELLDTTWATNGQQAFRNVKNDRKYKREMKQRAKSSNKNNKRNMKNINNKWFMSNPKEMFKTHRPDEIEWALLKHSARKK